jgi:hypothetical protein
MLKNYTVKAIHIETKRKRTHTVTANNIGEAIELFKKEGLIEPFDISETPLPPPEPATERQLEYAKHLKIEIPENATKDELSVLISYKVDNDSPPNPGLIDFATGRNISFSKHIGKKALYNLLFRALPLEDRIAFFAFSVYRSLSDDREANLDKHISKNVFYELAEQQLRNDQFLKSMNRYSGENLRFFGTMKFKDGNSTNGGSVNTVSYKVCAEFISGRFGTPKYKTTILKEERKSNQLASRPIVDSSNNYKGGCALYLILLIVISSIVILY